MSILGIAVIVTLLFFSWLVCHFMCEFKYYWCDGECQDCYNWKCRYFEKCNRRKRGKNYED